MNYLIKKMRKIGIHTNQNGFTLIEVLTAIFLFSVIMTLIGAVFVGVLNLQRKAFNLQQTEENANLVMEAMAKEIRVAKVTSLDTNCPTSWATTLSINHPVNGNITYSLSGGAIHRNVNGTDTVISSNTVQFTRLAFCIYGTPIDDRNQPRITIMASVKSSKTKQQSIIDFQTTLSQRQLSN